MRTRPIIREKRDATDLEVGLILLTVPGSPAISRIRRTKKGGVEVYVGLPTPLYYPEGQSVWVGR